MKILNGFLKKAENIKLKRKKWIFYFLIESYCATENAKIIQNCTYLIHNLLIFTRKWSDF